MGDRPGGSNQRLRTAQGRTSATPTARRLTPTGRATSAFDSPSKPSRAHCARWLFGLAHGHGPAILTRRVRAPLAARSIRSRRCSARQCVSRSGPVRARLGEGSAFADAVDAVVDGPELLTAGPGQLDLAVRLAERLADLELAVLALAQMVQAVVGAARGPRNGSSAAA